MPFKSVIETDRHLVVTIGTGALTGDEGLSCCTQLKERTDFDPAFNQLLDLRLATRFDATASQLQTIACQPLFSPDSRRAIVASDPAIFGIARMFQSYRGLSDVGENVMVFSDMSAALEWLEERVEA